MIPDFFINLFVGFIHFIVSFLPHTGIPSDVISSISGFLNSVYSFNSIFPIDTVMYIILAVLTFEAIMLGWSGTKWIIHLVRGN